MSFNESLKKCETFYRVLLFWPKMSFATIVYLYNTSYPVDSYTHIVYSL